MIDPDLVWLAAAMAVLMVPIAGVLVYQRVKASRQ